ncbi:MAG TPA: homoserine kinase, partial [Clostridia bacterium]|nr:homoserine kinase [Clostridia bacterium]
MITVRVPASTTNLGPGFDCLGMALELYNTVEMFPFPGKLYIEVQGEGANEIPRNRSNLVYIAACRVFEKTGYPEQGLRIRIANKIPVTRGLGSSASAIVGGLVGANIISGNKLSIKELLNIAAELEGHPDNVAAALLGGLVITTREDDEIKYIKIDPPKDLHCIVAVPDFALSTRVAREILPQQVTLQDAVFNLSRTASLVAAMIKGDLSSLGYAMDDKLHQSFRSSLIPGMKKVFAAAKLAGARGVCLSGAGPSVIAFADENFSLIARVMRETFWLNDMIAKVLI